VHSLRLQQPRPTSLLSTWLLTFSVSLSTSNVPVVAQVQILSDRRDVIGSPRGHWTHPIVPVQWRTQKHCWAPKAVSIKALHPAWSAKLSSLKTFNQPGERPNDSHVPDHSNHGSCSLIIYPAVMITTLWNCMPTGRPTTLFSVSHIIFISNSHH